MPELLIYLLLPNANIPWCSTNKKYLKNLQNHQKHDIRIIFNETNLHIHAGISKKIPYQFLSR